MVRRGRLTVPSKTTYIAVGIRTGQKGKMGACRFLHSIRVEANKLSSFKKLKVRSMNDPDQLWQKKEPPTFKTTGGQSDNPQPKLNDISIVRSAVAGEGGACRNGRKTSSDGERSR